MTSMKIYNTKQRYFVRNVLEKKQKNDITKIWTDLQKIGQTKSKKAF